MKFNLGVIKTLMALTVLALSVSASAAAQETRSEISVQGTGFITKDSDNNGISQKATKSGGFLLGYRYKLKSWLAAEANYGFSRNTQTYSGSATGRIQSNVHEITGAAVVKLPKLAKFEPFALAGGGALVFDPTNNAGGSFAGAERETRGAFLYGAGADYRLAKHWAVRAEYRGLVYKAPSFGVNALATDKFTHVAQPSAGIVFRF